MIVESMQNGKIICCQPMFPQFGSTITICSLDADNNIVREQEYDIDTEIPRGEFFFDSAKMCIYYTEVDNLPKIIKYNCCTRENSFIRNHAYVLQCTSFSFFRTLENEYYHDIHFEKSIKELNGFSYELINCGNVHVAAFVNSEKCIFYDGIQFIIAPEGLLDYINDHKVIDMLSFWLIEVHENSYTMLINWREKSEFIKVDEEGFAILGAIKEQGVIFLLNKERVNLNKGFDLSHQLGEVLWCKTYQNCTSGILVPDECFVGSIYLPEICCIGNFIISNYGIAFNLKSEEIYIRKCNIDHFSKILFKHQFPHLYYSKCDVNFDNATISVFLDETKFTHVIEAPDMDMWDMEDEGIMNMCFNRTIVTENGGVSLNVYGRLYEVKFTIENGIATQEETWVSENDVYDVYVNGFNPELYAMRDNSVSVRDIEHNIEFSLTDAYTGGYSERVHFNWCGKRLFYNLKGVYEIDENNSSQLVHFFSDKVDPMKLVVTGDGVLELFEIEGRVVKYTPVFGGNSSEPREFDIIIDGLATFTAEIIR
ncbi:hypothetical protein PCE1_003040 [Barthelona sp. PCE]